MGVTNRLIILLSYAYAACLGALLFRLFWLGIVRRYPAFAVFLTADFVGSAVGFITGTASPVYWWTYFLLTSVLGSLLMVLMSREMFAEIYYFHPGLRGMTKVTLYRSILVGIATTLLLAPVALVHWGEHGFTCWQLPVIETQRALKFGQAVFIALMWSRLRWLPLQIPRNVRVYSYLLGLYSLCSGVLSTIVMIGHTKNVSLVCGLLLFAVSIAFCMALSIAFQKPRPVPEPFEFCPLPDPEIVWRLTTMEGLLAQIDEAATHARKRVVRRAQLRVTAGLRWVTSGIRPLEQLVKVSLKLRAKRVPEGPKRSDSDVYKAGA